MQRNKLTSEDKMKLIGALNNDAEISFDLMPKLFPNINERFNVRMLDSTKIPTLEYAGKRSKATVLAETGAHDSP